MKNLSGKKIIVGITASIAAYKAIILVRSLKKAGAEVQVILTPDAAAFVTPLTLSTLSENPVHMHYFDTKTGVWDNHVHLALWADALIIAPATANTLAKMSTGLCDNLLMAVYLSAKSSIFLAPAMDLDMWKHPVTQKNISYLQSIGHLVIPPGSGHLASGLEGEGRLAEPEEILEFVDKYFAEKDSYDQSCFKGKKVLITAGPTYEAIDPVRFIGNHSTGKMGVEIAKDFLNRGAEVELVHGPISIEIPQNPRLKTTRITSAEELYNSCLEKFTKSDIIILAAAVADFTPEVVSDIKIKKKSDENGLTIQLKKTFDTAASIGEKKNPHQILIGFALETHNEVENAMDKLKRKNMDYIILNSLQDPGAGFGHDTNQVKIISKTGEIFPVSLSQKSKVAQEIGDYMEKQIKPQFD